MSSLAGIDMSDQGPQDQPLLPDSTGVPTRQTSSGSALGNEVPEPVELGAAKPTFGGFDPLALAPLTVGPNVEKVRAHEVASMVRVLIILVV
jgi:hypothetical protein